MGHTEDSTTQFQAPHVTRRRSPWAQSGCEVGGWNGEDEEGSGEHEK